MLTQDLGWDACKHGNQGLTTGYHLLRNKGSSRNTAGAASVAHNRVIGVEYHVLKHQLKRNVTALTTYVPGSGYAIQHNSVCMHGRSRTSLNRKNAVPTPVTGRVWQAVACEASVQNANICWGECMICGECVASG